ncbi:hypothetical protein Taro_024646 [Colocasia esculenta]|uniref:ZF-HD dimerization-type domain-containing protein n=1 Tax=Colocasia esculenta TaxID=4460 RepID=A0A843V818_COLES|nr:hypothetical protein [Colocasia esculenta]
MKKSHVVLRRCQQPQRDRTEPCTSKKKVKYGACQRNHAANLGGYAVDGCREFMASGEEGTADAIKCAACGCHRSFHRREQQEEGVDECSSPGSSRQ